MIYIDFFRSFIVLRFFGGLSFAVIINLENILLKSCNTEALFATS